MEDTAVETNSEILNIGDRQTTIGLWKLGKILGQGGSGHVRLAKHQQTGKFAAVKIIKKGSEQGTTASIQEAGFDIRHAIEREIVIMNLLTHPNITELYEIWDSKEEVYLVLEYVAGGDLLQLIARTPSLSEEDAARHFRQLIAGLSYLHDSKICHRDLKHENIMIGHQGNVKIADFGMAAVQPQDALFRSACGSPNYAAPEVVQGLPYNGPAADIWSTGVILYGLLTRKLPFDDPDTATILGRTIRAEYQLPGHLSSDAVDLVTHMLELDPEKRITLAQIPRHPFFWKGSRGALLHHSPTDGIACVENKRIVCRADMDIISKLKTLWMSQDEDIITSKVLSDEYDYGRLAGSSHHRASSLTSDL
ncbi:hypothetical protein DRE_07642 [Drechslerella stenobrocha 248]|uniref:Protein kinase domain-containing protein n=1 Tax=Drechslerella stenobrocha 248 TaxID=1043628 RepID=W7HK88_9PEZI|nr:hypothetical protein DRE_07642 [Drechslerella stenobrocha 248]